MARPMGTNNIIRGAVVISVIVLMAYLIGVYKPEPRLLTADNWVEAWAQSPVGEKQRVARFIIDEGFLIGWSEDRVLATLGPTVSINPNPEMWSMAWSIGSRESKGRLFFSYNEYLVVQLDGARRVVHVLIDGVD